MFHGRGLRVESTSWSTSSYWGSLLWYARPPSVKGTESLIVYLIYVIDSLFISNFTSWFRYRVIVINGQHWTMNPSLPFIVWFKIIFSFLVFVSWVIWLISRAVQYLFVITYIFSCLEQKMLNNKQIFQLHDTNLWVLSAFWDLFQL